MSLQSSAEDPETYVCVFTSERRSCRATVLRLLYVIFINTEQCSTFKSRPHFKYSTQKKIHGTHRAKSQQRADQTCLLLITLAQNKQQRGSNFNFRFYKSGVWNSGWRAGRTVKVFVTESTVFDGYNVFFRKVLCVNRGCIIEYDSFSLSIMKHNQR